MTPGAQHITISGAAATLLLTIGASSALAIDAAEAQALKSWRQVSLPQAESVHYSHLTSNGEQHVLLVVRTFPRATRQGEYGQQIITSSDAGETWSAPVIVPTAQPGSPFLRNMYGDNRVVERIAVDSGGRAYVQMGDGRILDMNRGPDTPMNETWGVPPPYMCMAMHAIGDRKVLISMATRTNWGNPSFTVGPPERVILVRNGDVIASSNGFLAGSTTTGAIVGVPDEFGSRITYQLMDGSGPLQALSTPFATRPRPLPYITTQLTDTWVDLDQGLCRLAGATVTTQPCANNRCFPPKGVPLAIMSTPREINGKKFLLKALVTTRPPEASDKITGRRAEFIEGWLSADNTWETFAVPTLQPWLHSCAGIVPVRCLSRPNEIHYVTAGATGRSLPTRIPGGASSNVEYGIWVYIGRGSELGKPRR